MNGKYLVLGAGGQLGRAWTALLGSRALPLTRAEADLSGKTFIEALERETAGAPLSAVVNCAAYTEVDKAEGEKAEAMRVNAEAVGELAAWCRKRDVPLAHYSTDYVFGDGVSAPRRESDEAAALNVYGQSKREGEKILAQSGARHLILRASWLYDAHGRNFFTTMLRLMREKEELRVVDDQIGAPTYAPQLAGASLAGLERALLAPEFPSGVYHLCHGGEASWFEFAGRILALARSRDSGIRCQRILPIVSAEYPARARRPLNSRLDCAKARAVLGIRLPPWEEGLNACMEEAYGSKGLPDCGPQTSTA